MKNILLSSVLFFVIATNLLSCVKGDTGPQGPQGATGTANLSVGLLVNQPWTYSSTYNDYSVTVNYNLITQTVLNAGAVLHYYSVAGASNWYTAPNPYVYTSDDVGVAYFYSPGNTNPGNSDFKVVVIAPDKMQGRTAKEWQSMPYTQVQQLLSKDIR